MPVVQLPFSKGLITDSTENDWLDALPVNCLAVPKAVLNANGYMRSWPGLVQNVVTTDIARGAVNNTVNDIVYRVQGIQLVQNDGTFLADVGGAGHASMPFSATTQGIVSQGSLNYWNGSVLTQLQNWAADEHAPGDPATTFDIGDVIDATYSRGRYAWIKQGSNQFGVTDLENEQRPDYVAPFYSAEASLDENIAIDTWRDYIVVFGRNSIEYFSLTGGTDPIYQPVQSLRVRAGIVGVAAKAQFYDTFAIVGGPELEPVSVFMITNGGYQEIATRRIQKILRSYTVAELATIYIEPVKFDAHDMLVIHLPRDVLVYDHASSTPDNRRWSVLKTDTYGTTPYRGIYHINAEGQWTAGDKQDGTISDVSFTVASHLGEAVEYELFTPMTQARNRRLFDLEVDNIPGNTASPYTLGYAVTYDGVSYTQDKWIYFDDTNQRRQRVLDRRLGYSRNNMGFRLRWITPEPSVISNLRVRIE